MTEQVWTQCPVCEGPMKDWESVEYVDAEMLTALTDLIGLIEKIAPEYSDSTMVSNARVIASKAKGADQ